MYETFKLRLRDVSKSHPRNFAYRRNFARGETAAIMTVYVDISWGVCAQPRESAACSNFRRTARATNYCWHHADYSSRCSHPRQIARDRAPRDVNIAHCLAKKETLLRTHFWWALFQNIVPGRILPWRYRFRTFESIRFFLLETI